MATQTSQTNDKQKTEAGAQRTTSQQTTSPLAPSSQSSNRTLARNQTGYTPLSRYSELTSPFGLMGRWMDDMERMLLGGTAPPRRWDQQLWNPQIEAFERGDKLVVRADLPGVPDDQISVQVEGDMLTISGHRSDDRKEEREGYYHSERSYGSFQRSIALPPGIDADAITASFEHGVLEVTLPKPPPKPSGKKIGIGKSQTTTEQAKTAPTGGKPS
jgi:HSP20 family protein